MHRTVLCRELGRRLGKDVRKTWNDYLFAAYSHQGEWLFDVEVEPIGGRRCNGWQPKDPAFRVVLKQIPNGCEGSKMLHTVGRWSPEWCEAMRSEINISMGLFGDRTGATALLLEALEVIESLRVGEGRSND